MRFKETLLNVQRPRSISDIIMSVICENQTPRFQHRRKPLSHIKEMKNEHIKCVKIIHV